MYDTEIVPDEKVKKLELQLAASQQQVRAAEKLVTELKFSNAKLKKGVQVLETENTQHQEDVQRLLYAYTQVKLELEGYKYRDSTIWRKLKNLFRDF